MICIHTAIPLSSPPLPSPFGICYYYNQRMSKLSNSNKENIRDTSSNSRRSIKLKSSDRRCFGELLSNETGFFNNPSTQFQVEKEGQEKLIQLTAQCAQYFERFTSEKDAHLQIIHRSFCEITEKIEVAFGKIILEAQRKLNEIRTFLSKEHERLRQEKATQEDSLNTLLIEIKSVHLTKLDSAESFDMKELLAGYAATLDKFFNIMMEIESSSYEDSVEESMNFINNLVKQELRVILEDKFPPKVEDLLAGHFSSDECFTFELEGIRASEDTVSLLDNMDRPNKENQNPANIFQEIESIKCLQRARESHITQYRSLLLSPLPLPLPLPHPPLKGLRSSQ